MKNRMLLLVTVLAALVIHSPSAVGQMIDPDTIAYQGRLKVAGGTPDPGARFDLRFRLFDAAAGGNQLDESFVQTVAVDSNGLFTVLVDVDNINIWSSSGTVQWIELGARRSGATSNHVTLNPRQRVSPVPTALHARHADVANSFTGAVSVAQLPANLNADLLDGLDSAAFARGSHTHSAADLVLGLLPDGRLGGTYSGVLNFASPANIFAGNGAALTGLNAASLANGTVPDARLSSNVAFLTATQTFTGPVRFSPATGAPFLVGSSSKVINLNADSVDGLDSTAFAGAAHTHSAADIVSGTLPETRIDPFIARDSEIFPLVLANDGAGSGLNSDLFDGLDSAVFARLTHTHSAADITSGLLPEARLSANVPLLDRGTNQFTGANLFSPAGNATGLTVRKSPAATSGTDIFRVQSADGGSNYFRVSSSGQVNWSGMVGGDGSGLTALNANNITSGILSEARIDPAMARVNQVVRSLNNVRDDVVLSAGEGLALSTVGNNIQIAAAATCGSTYSNCFWNLRGNGNLTPGVHFLGTVAGELDPLDFRVNNLRGLRLQPDGGPFVCDIPSGTMVDAQSPSLVGGYAGNTIDAGVAGSVIAGGGAFDYACLGGNLPNRITAPLANIGGGLGNEVRGAISTVGGGYLNRIEHSANYCVIAGGGGNLISSAGVVASAADGSTISGGSENEIRDDSNGSTISGGIQNLIDSNIDRATIGGGEANKVAANYATVSGGHSNIVAPCAEFTTISGGHQHRIEPGAVRATIGGGLRNVIGTNAHNSTISGGRDHLIGTGADHATIGGGQGHEIQRDANHSTIGGGVNHTIEINAQYGTIGGGNFNIIRTNADYATIPGGRYAVANNYGQQAYASGRFTSEGDAQTSLYVSRRTTTTIAPAELFLDGLGQRMVLPVDSTWTFQVMVAARNDGGVSGGWIIQGVIERQANETVLVALPNVTALSKVEGGIGTVRVEADNINEALIIRVTQGTPSIGAVRWVASTRTTEVNY